MSIAVHAHGRSENLRGIGAMLLAMAAFVVNDTLMKLAGGRLPIGEAIFIRATLTTGLGLILIVGSGMVSALAHAFSSRVMWRAAADLDGTFTFLAALVHMPMADIFGLLQFVPLAVTAGAAVFMGAKVGWRRWTATCVGLLGVLLIVRPGGVAFEPYTILAILAVIFSAARDLLSRSVPGHVPPLVIVTTAAALVALTSPAFIAFEDWRQPSLSTFGILVVAAAALLAGQYWLVAAMRTGEIAVVAPFRYSILLWAILAGFLVWGEVPDLPTWAGIAIVTGAGLYTFLREQRLKKLARA
ncbi:MAG: DMT family transporter [Hyphomicrobiaceae bacterium]|jgi:drug/metabolite transporter (DMT)-like permease